jgi:predicted MFS family arabinose efflux permease
VWEFVGRIHLAQDKGNFWALMTTVMNLCVPKKAENFSTSYVTVSFSRALLPGFSYLVSL